MRYALLTTSLLLLIPAAAEAQVPGSYRRTCNSITFDGQTLSANCRRARGGFNQTSLDVDRCGRADVENRNGRLICGDSYGSARPIDGYDRPRGGYGYNGDEGGGYRPRYAPPSGDDDYAPRRRRYDPNGDE